MKKFDYENKVYLDKLNDLSLSYYSKYIKHIKKYLVNKNSIFLDVGCGNGIVLNELKKAKYSNGYGIDISKLFIKEAKSKRLDKVYYYDGSKFPFKNNFFDLIGSFNVLEHTENPEGFIKEQILKLKSSGILIISCPNFLSVLFPSNHRKLKGIKNKTKNLFNIIKKIIYPSSKFEKMPPIIRENFEYDDDAIVVTNLLDLKRVLSKYNCKIIYESGFINYDTFIYRLINMSPFIKYMLPSCFIVAQKK
jgi:2-polyprenyl-3-methyl-5-hydroxy-6-metoxy-1,4-benzoquinol methylase